MRKDKLLDDEDQPPHAAQPGETMHQKSWSGGTMRYSAWRREDGTVRYVPQQPCDHPDLIFSSEEEYEDFMEEELARQEAKQHEEFVRHCQEQEDAQPWYDVLAEGWLFCLYWQIAVVCCFVITPFYAARQAWKHLRKWVRRG